MVRSLIFEKKTFSGNEETEMDFVLIARRSLVITLLVAIVQLLESRPRSVHTLSPHAAARLVYHLAYGNTLGNNEIPQDVTKMPRPSTPKLACVHAATTKYKQQVLILHVVRFQKRIY